MAGPVPLYVLYIVAPILFSLLLPFLSWAIGRWYQDRIMSTLEEEEKVIVNAHGFENKASVTTSNKMSQVGAEYSTLLHISLCVGPSTGQIFFMWIKSIFGGRLHSYDVVLDYGRREAMLRLRKQAAERGCTSMINIRIETSVISFAKSDRQSNRASVEFLAFATGIR
jgi:uncharacterized protein YbjQ (UPF0145 family)